MLEINGTWEKGEMVRDYYNHDIDGLDRVYRVKGGTVSKSDISLVVEGRTYGFNVTKRSAVKAATEQLEAALTELTIEEWKTGRVRDGYLVQGGEVLAKINARILPFRFATLDQREVKVVYNTSIYKQQGYDFDSCTATAKEIGYRKFQII